MSTSLEKVMIERTRAIKAQMHHGTGTISSGAILSGTGTVIKRKDVKEALYDAGILTASGKLKEIKITGEI